MAEFLGTFALVFAGTGAIVVNEPSGGVITQVGIALMFGLVVLAMIYTLGDISGAHINPVRDNRLLGGPTLFPCLSCLAICSESICRRADCKCVAALAVSCKTRCLAARVPAGTAVQSFVLEMILTAGLMFVILGVSTGAREKGITAGIVIGSVITLEALFAGPVCGASMNPARSLGPAVVSKHFEQLWIYLLAPVLGASIGVLGCCCVRETGCCSRLTSRRAEEQ